MRVLLFEANYKDDYNGEYYQSTNRNGEIEDLKKDNSQ